MKFCQTFPHILSEILEEDPSLGKLFVGKFDLVDAYMRVWIHLNDIPDLTSVVSLALVDSEILLGSNIIISMGHMESATIFHLITETMLVLINTLLCIFNATNIHPLEK